jgi:glutamine amidotransferase
MRRVAVIEYGMGNLDSVVRAVEECGGEARVTDQGSVLASAQAVILPGVGSFAVGMRNIRAKGLDELLTEHVARKGVPVLGICLGMQLLSGKGHEGGETPGLGWIEGEVEKLRTLDAGERLPHVGWNEVHPSRHSPLWDRIEPGRDFYFTHSYAFRTLRAQDVLATTPFCGGFVSAVGRDNVLGVQFHPEKSQKAGFQLIKNFLAL